MECCKMDRVEEMQEFLQEIEVVLLKERMDKIKSVCMNNETNIRKEIIDISEELIRDRTEGCLVISYLRSSYITENHEFYIAYYADEPFVEEEPDSRYYSLTVLFEGIEDDLQCMDKKLKNKYIHILTSEKEEIRREFINRIYMGMGIIFKLIFENRQARRNIDVFYGNYMGELELLGKM